MNEKFEFEQYGVVALSDNEMVIIRGGDADLKIPKFLKGLTFWGVVATIAENWPEIKSGLSDGWKSFD